MYIEEEHQQLYSIMQIVQIIYIKQKSKRKRGIRRIFYNGNKKNYLHNLKLYRIKVKAVNELLLLIRFISNMSSKTIREQLLHFSIIKP